MDAIVQMFQEQQKLEVIVCLSRDPRKDNSRLSGKKPFVGNIVEFVALRQCDGDMLIPLWKCNYDFGSACEYPLHLLS